MVDLTGDPESVREVDGAEKTPSNPGTAMISARLASSALPSIIKMIAASAFGAAEPVRRPAIIGGPHPGIGAPRTVRSEAGGRNRHPRFCDRPDLRDQDAGRTSIQRRSDQRGSVPRNAHDRIDSFARAARISPPSSSIL